MRDREILICFLVVMHRLIVLLIVVCILGALAIIGFFAFLAMCSYKISHPDWNPFEHLNATFSLSK